MYMYNPTYPKISVLNTWSLLSIFQIFKDPLPIFQHLIKLIIVTSIGQSRDF